MSKLSLIALLCFACLTTLLTVGISAEDSSLGVQKNVVVQADGTVEIPEQTALVSTFLNPEAKAYLSQHLKDNADVPESKDALNVMIKFFDRHLAGVANLRASAAPTNEVR